MKARKEEWEQERETLMAENEAIKQERKKS
jgi:hypothetical protein